MNLDNIRRILTQPQMEVSACKKKCWRHLVFAQRLSFFIASYLTDEHLEPTKSIQDNRSKKYPESHIFFFYSYLVSLNQRPRGPWSEDQRHFGRTKELGDLKKAPKVEIYVIFAFFAFHTQRTKSDFKDWGSNIQYIARRPF